MSESENDYALCDTIRQEVNNALEAILATEKFDAAPQMSAFLRYVVEQTADGHQSRIKAFSVAVDALGKPDNFDPQNDPVVRVLAGRLRAALTAYNEEHPDAPVIISMTPGSYVPSFKHPEANSQPISGEASQTSDEAIHSGFHEQEQSNDDAPAQASATHLIEIEKTSPNNAPLESSTVTDQDSSDVRKEHSVLGKAMREPGAMFDPSYPPGLLDGLFGGEVTAPKAMTACAVAGAILIGLVLNYQNSDPDPGILAATPVINAKPASLPVRARPDMPAVFVSAIDQGNALENSLNTVVSGVISGSDHLHVYRILEAESKIRFWPEDYILTLTALDLPNEKRVSMQLIEADSGRVVHSRDVSLEEQADDQVTQAELAQLIDAAQSIVSKTGPLLQHYNSRRQTP